MKLEEGSSAEKKSSLGDQSSDSDESPVSESSDDSPISGSDPDDSDSDYDYIVDTEEYNGEYFFCPDDFELVPSAQEKPKRGRSKAPKNLWYAMSEDYNPRSLEDALGISSHTIEEDIKYIKFQVHGSMKTYLFYAIKKKLRAEKWEWNGPRFASSPEDEESSMTFVFLGHASPRAGERVDSCLYYCFPGPRGNDEKRIHPYYVITRRVSGCRETSTTHKIGNKAHIDEIPQLASSSSSSSSSSEKEGDSDIAA